MVHAATCPLCEASCGLLVDTDGAGIHSIRGDADDPFSRGYLCPKAAALADLQDDPDSGAGVTPWPSTMAIRLPITWA